MDTSIISEVVLPLVFVGVGAVLIWFLVEAIQFLRRTRTTVETMEAQITPILKDVQEITDSIKPAVDKVDPLVERVSLAVDAANLEIMRLDGILENVDRIAETTASAASAVDTVANTPLKLVESATEKLRDAFAARKASDESASLAASAEASKASSIAAGPQDDAASGAAVKHAGTEAPEGSGENYFTYASKEE
ncbi:DUF948 domain-containing protein [uncultured Slackia sp.]|uniref:DUF948 domain-containing protein n=1 Tax=uncultured Slackia sp. TaxID=665903 RepID=UPI0026E09910|nr:DUF948 domain-containing protein [uncultured Slackia sp.]